MPENWRQIKGWPYEVSDQGRVRRQETGRLLKPWPVRNGYLRIALSRWPGHEHYRVHRLVLEAFVGPCPPGHEAAHANGDPRDNRLSNLRWATRMDNEADKVRHGRALIGNRNPQAQLTAEIVLAMRRRYRRTDPRHGLTAMAREFGVSVNTVRDAVMGRTWKCAS